MYQAVEAYPRWGPASVLIHILTVKAEHVATFLGHRITAQLAQEIGSQFATRIEGTCVRHRFGGEESFAERQGNGEVAP